MELIRPDFGLLFWMLISFGIVLLILRRFAWGPILNALKTRERTIQERLDVARKAKKELAEIEFGNERIIALAKTERANMLKEAQQTKKQIIEEARQEARQDKVEVISYPDAFGRKTTVTIVYLGGDSGIERWDTEVEYAI